MVMNRYWDTIQIHKSCITRMAKINQKDLNREILISLCFIRDKATFCNLREKKKLRNSVIRIMYFLQIIQQYFYYNTQMNRNESILLFDEKDILIDFIKKEDKS